MTTDAGNARTLDGVVIGNAPLIRVRGLVNRFGEQTVHDGWTWTCAAARSSAWSAARAPASRC
jgi:hypothetical protein